MIPPGGTRGDALQQAGPLPNVGGQRSGHNIYLLDGFKVTDELFNNLVINPSVDSIQEFKIQKSQYPAEFGGKASALINVATRAGTNAFRGSVFEFLRHDVFDAHNYFDPRDQPVPPLRQHQFGGALGGPLCARPELLLLQLRRAARAPFADADVLGADAGRPERRFLRRRPDLRSGDDRSGDRHLHAIRGQSDPGGPHRPARRGVAAARAAADIRRRAAEPDVDRQAGEGRRSDQPARSTIGSRRAISSSPGSARSMPTRSSRSARAACRRHWSRASAATSSTKARNLGVSHTHLFGRSVVNELRFGWMRVTGGQVSQNRGVDFASQVGLQGVTTDPRDVGFPQISTRGLYSTFGDPTSFVYRDNQHFELYDNVIARSGRASRQVRRLLLPPAVQARAAGQRARRVHVYRAIQRQCVRRLPAGVSDVGGVRHRPRRRGRPDQLAAPLRAGRLADAAQPHRERGAALRVQPAHARPAQPALVRGLRHAGRPLRDRERRQRQHQSRGAGVAAADPDSVRHVAAGRLGARAAQPEQGAPRPAHGIRPVAR